MPNSREAIEVSYRAFYLNPESFMDKLATVISGWRLSPVDLWMKPEDWVRYLSKNAPPSKLCLALNPPMNANNAGLVVFTSGPPIEISTSIKKVTVVQIRPDIELPQLRFINAAGALLLVSRSAQGGIAVSPSEAPNLGEPGQDTSTSIRIQYS